MTETQDILDTLYLYRKSRNYTHVLGFQVDSNLYNFSWLANCEYVQEDLDTSRIPGLQMIEANDMYLTPPPPTDSKGHVRVKVGSSTIDVNIRCIYNGKEFLVTHMYSYIPNVDYALIVVSLYKMITGCNVGFDSYKQEAEDEIGSIVTTRYSPITSGYVAAMSTITDDCAAGYSTAINKKYDGVHMWLYLSNSTPASLLQQIKSHKIVQRKYVGTVADFADPELREMLCIPIERISSSEGYVYIALDLFTRDDLQVEYSKRLEKLNEVIRRYKCSIGPYHIHLQLYVTDSTILKYSPENICSLVSVMGKQWSNTDGFVIYSGIRRPMKLKLREHLTVDLEYRVAGSTGSWISKGELPCTLAEPDLYLLSSVTDNILVMEVRVCNGQIVRLRTDRTRGNSQLVIDQVIRTYHKDLKYSSIDVWSGSSIKLPILLNRCFKRYMHRKYLHIGASVLDFGSGNGGDVHIWRDMRYKIMCIELSKERYVVLRERIKSLTGAASMNEDMKNLEHILSRTSIKYRCVSYMRSLSMLAAEDIIVHLTRLREYGCTNIIIVTMVSDYVEDYEYSHGSETFSISRRGRMVTVSYTLENKSNSYTDNCLSIAEWLEIFRLSKFKADVVSQAEFMMRAYGLSRTFANIPSFTDVGFSLHLA